MMVELVGVAGSHDSGFPYFEKEGCDERTLSKHPTITDAKVAALCRPVGQYPMFHIYADGLFLLDEEIDLGIQVEQLYRNGSFVDRMSRAHVGGYLMPKVNIALQQWRWDCYGGD